MKKIFIFALLSTTSPALSETGTSCSKIAEDSLRLACYDNIFATSDNVSVQSAGKWRKRVDTSELTDDKNIFLSLTSENNIKDKYGNGSGKGSLNLRCLENTTSVLFEFNDLFMSDNRDYGLVEYRLDKEAMKKIQTQESTDHKVLGIWSGGRSIPFIKAMLPHKKLVVRATPFGESPITLTFDITGIDSEIIELRNTCGW